MSDIRAKALGAGVDGRAFEPAAILALLATGHANAVDLDGRQVEREPVFETARGWIGEHAAHVGAVERLGAAQPEVALAPAAAGAAELPNRARPAQTGDAHQLRRAGARFADPTLHGQIVRVIIARARHCSDVGQRCRVMVARENKTE